MTTEQKQIRIGDVFSDDDLQRAAVFMSKTGNNLEAVEQIEQHIVVPRMAKINELTQQENVPRYFAYLLIHVITEHTLSSIRKPAPR